MDLEQELQRLARETEEKRPAIIAKHAVLNSGISSVTEGYGEPHVHYSRLYGRVGLLSFKAAYAFSLQRGKVPDAALLRTLLEHYPPLPKVMVKDGCKSFRTVTQEWGGDVRPVNPVTIRLDIFQDHRAEYHWYANINGQIWEFEVVIPLYQTRLGNLDARPKRYAGGNGEISSWEVCQFYPTCSPRPNVIRWASGAPQYPNSFTLWWEVDQVVDFPATIKA